MDDNRQETTMTKHFLGKIRLVVAGCVLLTLSFILLSTPDKNLKFRTSSNEKINDHEVSVQFSDKPERVNNDVPKVDANQDSVNSFEYEGMQNTGMLDTEADYGDTKPDLSSKPKKSLFDPNAYKKRLIELHESALEHVTDSLPKEQLWVNQEAIRRSKSLMSNPFKPRHKSDYVTTGILPSSKHTSSSDKVILFWTRLYRFTPDFATDRGRFTFKSCSYKNCKITADRANLKDADAVIFSTYDMRNVDDDMPNYRSPRQRWILYGHESPINTYVTPKFNGLFNATVTYLLDSDVWFGYGSYRKRSEPSREDISSFARKPKLITWIVSNCGVHSRRGNYVDELRKYIKVDIFGLCAHQRCGDNNAFGEQKCREMIRAEYKFYLALENTLCYDYITEKPWKALKNNAVPVVLGYVNYTKHLPPHSFINIKDFSSPQKLAEYLTYLDENDAEYLKYFDWRKKYEAVTSNPQLCYLCKYLNEHANEVQTYKDINGWWNQCVVPRDFYQGTFDDLIKRIDNGTMKRFFTFGKNVD